MKVNHHGQAEPIFLDGYRKIRAHFITPGEKLLWDIAYYTGERWGAIVQLAVSDVYNDRGLPRDSITFKKSTRKDKTTRQVLVSDTLALRLKAYAVPSSIWLFPSPKLADRHIAVRTADASFRRALDRAGFTGLGYSTHSTRRGFITSLHREGIDIRVIQEITGHKNLAVLSKYIDVTDAQKRSALATL
jgi:integrase/recombinase XerD